MPKSRIANSMINMVYSFGVKLVSFLASFVLRTVFIRVLGMEYAGISGLFTDVLTVLSFAELGISTAMTYALYKPIAEQNEKKIQSLMYFYKWAYRFVAVGVLIIGLICVPLLPIIITDVPNIEEDITLIYVLYLLNTVSSYLLIYKSTLLTASQRNYEISKTTIRISVVKCIAGCILLILFRNFIVYLLMEIALAIFQNILTGRKAEALFPHVLEPGGEKLERGEVRILFHDIKALFLYKISGVVLSGTDSIIISGFLGTGLVGILANYNLIVKNIYKLILQVFSSTSASIGNLAATSGKDRQYEVFAALLFMAFCLFGFCSVELYVGLNSFMTIWMGAENTFSMSIVIVLIIDFYIMGMMSPISSFRTSNGLFVQGQYRPLLMTLINIVISILLVKKTGVLGVLLGTVISRLLTQVWYDPYLIYKHVFKKSVFDYVKKIFIYSSITAVCCVVCRQISVWYIVGNLFIKLILDLMCGTLLFSTSCVLLFRKKKEFLYLKQIGMNLAKYLRRKVVG